MSRKTPISELMTTQVHTLEVGAKLSEVRRMLTEQRVHHVPIVAEGVPVGMVSSRDLVRILRAAKPAAGASIDETLDRSSTVAKVMSSELVTVGADESVERAIESIADGSVHSVLVLDAGRRLVGIVTDTDLLDYLCE
jgi:CBS domain-containing membrane protein